MDKNDIKPKPQKVISGDVKAEAKTPFMDKAVEFLLGDDIPTVKKRTAERIKDAAQNAVYNVVDEGKYFLMDILESVITGGSPTGKFRRFAGGSSRAAATNSSTRYDAVSSKSKRDTRRAVESSASDYNTLRFSTRGDAESVIFSMQQWIDKYNQGSVADLYELAGVPAQYTDEKYGWTEFNAEIRRTHDDPEHPYLLIVPRPQPLELL